MSSKPRRLHSVPTGPDAARPAGPDPATESPPTPFRTVSPDPQPSDTQALMDRIGRSADADRSRNNQHPGSTQRSRRRRPVTLRVRTDGLPPVPADLLARSAGPPGSAVQNMLSRIDFTAPAGLPLATASRVAFRYSWLLNRVGADGLHLTSAGYLRPVDVSAAFTELDLGSEWIGTGNREINVRPLLMLRQSAQRLGLLRNSRGLLSLTKAGASIRDDPAALVDWIASRLPLGRADQERDAGLALLTVIAAGGAGDGRSIDEMVADVMSALGWRGIDGRPITGPVARAAADSTALVLRHLGAVVRPPRSLERTITAQGAQFARLALSIGSPGQG